VFPLKKFTLSKYLFKWRTASEAFQALEGLCDIIVGRAMRYTHDIKFGILQVRENPEDLRT